MRVAEAEGSESYPYDVLPQCIPGDEPRGKYVVIMDADTWVNGDLREVLPGPDEDISLRVANAWVERRIRRSEWAEVCAHFAVPMRPVFSNGIMACRGDIAALLRRDIPIFTALVRQQGALGRIPDPLHLRHRPPWWMSDQFALSIIVSEQGWRVRKLGRKLMSWNYVGEFGGTVHHLGKKVNPFAEESWEDFRQDNGDS